ncbi:hypothetical protein OHR68_39485 [Spirillospora sp. NBC_00431]
MTDVSRRPILRPITRPVTHPLAPAVAILSAALALVSVDVVRGTPVTMAWVVAALSAGYSISGSV